MSFLHSKPIPRYLLPNEVTVFWTLLRLRPVGKYEFEIPIREVAQEARLSYTTTYLAIKALALKGYVRYAPGRIVYRPSRFRLLCTYDPRYPRPTSESCPPKQIRPASDYPQGTSQSCPF